MTALLFSLNTVLWCTLLYPIALIKVIFPFRPWQDFCTRIMVAIGENWISCNEVGLGLLQNIQWNVQGLENLQKNRSYLVSANHQSWVDIVILQKVFNRRIPFLRFFLKQELIYVPLLGIVWWALDFPFMKRYSKSYLERHPEKRGQDLNTTRKACERFRGKQISILNFLEGTRFTLNKHERQASPYQHLLKPKTGGIAFVIEAMGDQFHSYLDVTIHYPQGSVSMWGLFTGQLGQVNVFVRELKIPSELIGGNYLEDIVFREKMQAWVQKLWLEKDALLKAPFLPKN